MRALALTTLVALVFLLERPREENQMPRAARDPAYRNDKAGALEARIATLRHRVAELEAENERLRARPKHDANITKLEEQIRTLEFRLGQYKRRSLDHWADTWQQQSQQENGVVTDVRALRDGGVVLGVSLGSEDGVSLGDVYYLRRGADYVGQVTITKVYLKESVGEFDTRYRGGAAPPRAQDVVYPGN